MNVNLKNISILGLVGLFFVSAIMCCCITKTVHAQELASSCHLTEHETDSRQNTEDCDCDQSSAILKKDIGLHNTFVTTAVLGIEQQSESQILYSSFGVAYQAFPQYYSTLPIYIKHSNLRI